MPTSGEWLLFLGTAAVFALTPGPGIVYVLARSMRGGRAEGVRSVVGNAIGACVHVLAAALGLSALLATSAWGFTVLKWVGAAYLVFLGVQTLRRRNAGEEAEGRATGRWARSPLTQGVLTELSNPKTALYFLALLPHFVHPDRAPAPLVFGLLGLVAVVMAMTVDLVVAVFAGRIGDRLRSHPRWRVRQRVASGLVMIGLGGAVAAAEP